MPILGKKTREWLKRKPKLIEIYFKQGITRCEISNSKFALSFHHIKKRSSQEAEHTFEGTRLLNQEWHEFCEYNRQANELLISKPRGFDKQSFEKFKAMKIDKKKINPKKADWQRLHKCKHCKTDCSMLLCPKCGKMSV